MFFPFVLFAVSVVCSIDKQPTLVVETTLPDDLQTWCPNTKFCQADSTDILHESSTDESSSKGNSGTNMIQCCESCSCSPDCGLTRNCCTSENDQYKLDESLGTVCKPLNNRVFRSPDDVVYHMVDKCPTTDKSCNTANVSTWGSYSPVYSESTGMIYYNSDCAACHNQNNTATFLPVLACPSSAGQYSNIFENVLNGLEDECYLEFMQPANIDMSREICYSSMIRDCISNVNASSQLRDKCASFNATFHTGSKTYQNVYCYLCRMYTKPSPEKWLENHGVCPGKIPNRDVSKSSLIVLLDDSSIDKYKRSVLRPEGIKTICLGQASSSGSKACRPVHCPEAHFRLNGKCELFGQNWHVRNVQLFAFLTPSNNRINLTVSDLAALSIEELDSKSKAFIQRPGLKDWEMELFYSAFENNTVRYIMAIMFMGSKTIRSKKLLSTIQTSFQNKWKLYIKGKVIELKATFNKFISYQMTRAQSHIPIVENGRASLNFDPSWMKFNDARIKDFRMKNLSVISYHYFQPIDLCITNLFFCEQLDLPSNEFIMLSLGEVYLVYPRKFLGSGEFILTRYKDGIPDAIRVCLEDVLGESTATTTMSALVIYMTLCQCLFVIFTI